MNLTYRKHASLLPFLLLFFLSTNVLAQTNLQSPNEYLGYELGDQFTPHYKVLGYFKQAAEASPMITYESYGTTNEGRELGIVKVSTEENHAKLEQIRTDNLKRTGLAEGEIQGGDIPIVWLSYNVHGNESSSSEAAMKTLQELVRADRSDTKQWLQKTVVIMDPMLNPDGRDRYVHWYNETVGTQFNAQPEAREHREPWPGGRTNHYYFDLNRDWAWLTQKESRQRLAVYQQWMPQIHVDFHEQGYNDPYYFAPAAEPFHNAITDWQRQFQVTIGENHAGYFDKNNWLYFTKEVFDLFYPSYGDTYPIFNGAIGMTYEQGGSGFAGLGIIKAEEDTLTLYDRLLHHHTTGLSTVEVTANNAQKVLDEFETYFQTALEEPAGEYKSYVIKNDSSANVRALLGLLDQHQIAYGRLGEEDEFSGFNYRSGEQEDGSFDADDIVVSAYQPKSVLARVLLEPRPELVDSLTYDITAWALPYAYGVEAYAVEDRIEGELFYQSETDAVGSGITNTISGEPYAYLADWEDVSDVAFLAELLKNEINLRVAQEPFSTDGRDYKAGTLVITRNGNTGLGSKFDDIVQEAAESHYQQLYGVSSGFVSSGADFGSDRVKLVEAPRVALLSGSGTSSGNVGQVWHFFDKQIGYPVTLIDTDYFEDVRLYEFDVMILPSGPYGDKLDESQLKKVESWVRAGGTLIALQGANELLAGKEGFGLKKKDDEEGKEEAVNGGDDEEAESDAEIEEKKLKTYRQRQRESATDFNPGSIFKITMDNTHPLAFGYDEEYFSLKLDADAYTYLDEGWNVGVTKEDAHQSGFTGYEAKEKLENTLTFGVESIGRGSVVYMVDNPLFRAFWYNGKLLFGNAVFIVN
jgi:hypothetical protein